MKTAICDGDVALFIFRAFLTKKNRRLRSLFAKYQQNFCSSCKVTCRCLDDPENLHEVSRVARPAFLIKMYYSTAVKVFTKLLYIPFCYLLHSQLNIFCPLVCQHIDRLIQCCFCEQAWYLQSLAYGWILSLPKTSNSTRNGQKFIRGKLHLDEY